MRMRMLIGLVLVILILLIIILFVGAALLLSTGNSPEGKISGVYGLVYQIEDFLAEMLAGAADWIEYIGMQIGKLNGYL
jgi:hypothetical protein